MGPHNPQIESLTPPPPPLISVAPGPQYYSPPPGLHAWICTPCTSPGHCLRARRRRVIRRCKTTCVVNLKSNVVAYRWKITMNHSNRQLSSRTTHIETVYRTSVPHADSVPLASSTIPAAQVLQSPAVSAVPTSRNSMAGKVCEKSSTRNLAILLETARDPAPVLV